MKKFITLVAITLLLTSVTYAQTTVATSTGTSGVATTTTSLENSVGDNNVATSSDNNAENIAATTTIETSDTEDTNDNNDNGIGTNGDTSNTLSNDDTLEAMRLETVSSMLSSTSTGTTTTGTTTNELDMEEIKAKFEELYAHINHLHHELDEAESMLDELWTIIGSATSTNPGGNNGGNNGTTTGTTTDPGGNNGGNQGTAVIYPMTMTASPGSSVDWNGRGFLHEQNVTITLNGQTVRTAHADGGGNFSTGGVSLPTTAGMYTYIFRGERGDSAQSTITITGG